MSLFMSLDVRLCGVPSTATVLTFVHGGVMVGHRLWVIVTHMLAKIAGLTGFPLLTQFELPPTPLTGYCSINCVIGDGRAWRGHRNGRGRDAGTELSILGR
jgi:hypothetical protein